MRFHIVFKIKASLVYYSVDSVLNPSNTENSDILFA